MPDWPALSWMQRNVAGGVLIAHAEATPDVEVPDMIAVAHALGL